MGENSTVLVPLWSAGVSEALFVELKVEGFQSQLNESSVDCCSCFEFSVEGLGLTIAARKHSCNATKITTWWMKYEIIVSENIKIITKQTGLFLSCIV